MKPALPTALTLALVLALAPSTVRATDDATQPRDHNGSSETAPHSPLHSIATALRLHPSDFGGLASALPATAIRFASLPATAQTAPRAPRDSFKNGALIGAVVGAAALGGYGLFLCHALDDTGGDPDCFPEILTIAAVGGGIGLGAGVAVDAMLTRHHTGAALGVRVTVRSRGRHRSRR